MPGKLYVVSTPIGNLKDMTLRAIEILKTVSLVLAEDTRVSSKLLNAYSIPTPLRSNFAGNEARRTTEAVSELLSGKDVALISDAGTPSISDPGCLLVKACRDNGIEVVPIPGASSLSTAVSVSGFPDHPLLFMGFAGKKESERKKSYEEIKPLPCTVVFFESPVRVRRFISELYGNFPERDLFVAREMTKKFESYLMNPAAEEIPEKGEFVVILSPPRSQKKELNIDEIKAEFARLVGGGSIPKDAVKALAKSCKIPKRVLYNILLVKDEVE